MFRTRSRQLIGQLFAALLMLAPAAIADQSPNEVLHVGYEEFPPYSFTDSNGIARGFSIDLIRHIVEPLGYRVQFVPGTNPSGILEMLAQGQIDMSGLLAVTPEREQLGIFTLPMGTYATSLFVLDDFFAQTPDDLSGMRVGVVEGSFAVNAAGTIPFVEMVEIDNFDALIVPLLTGSVDAVANLSETFLARLRQANVDGAVRVIEQPLLESPRGFLVNPDRVHLIEAINESIQSRLSNGEELLLQERWFGRPTRLSDHRHFAWFVALGVSGLVAFCSLAYLAWNSKMSERTARRETRASQLLLDALNGIEAAIVIYDKDFVATHWNEGFVRAFPRLVSTMQVGATLGEMIALSYVDGTISADTSKCDGEEMARSVIARVTAGQETTRTVYTGNGRVFEAREFRVGKTHYAAVRVDVTRLHNQAEEIRRQQVDLKAANEKLQVFSTIAAHDLKAPLNQQTSLLEFIAEDLEEAGVALPKDVTDNLALISVVSNRMKRLVGDLLDYARSDGPQSGAIRIDPGARLRNVVALAAVPDGFSIDIAPDMPAVTVSPTAFDTVLRNLISNAVKHHDNLTGAISIRGFQYDDEVVIEVQDDGPGIPEKHRGSVFEPFKRLTGDDGAEGSGLGLSFIQRTVERWGGKVSVDCPEPRGCIFRITIPNGNPNRPASAAKPVVIAPEQAAHLTGQGTVPEAHRQNGI